jgi:hypothetical protein
MKDNIVHFYSRFGYLHVILPFLLWVTLSIDLLQARLFRMVWDLFSSISSKMLLLGLKFSFCGNLYTFFRAVVFLKLVFKRRHSVSQIWLNDLTVHLSLVNSPSQRSFPRYCSHAPLPHLIFCLSRYLWPWVSIDSIPGRGPGIMLILMIYQFSSSHDMICMIYRICIII